MASHAVGSLWGDGDPKGSPLSGLSAHPTSTGHSGIAVTLLCGRPRGPLEELLSASTR
jgi:hypothetical protein